jgi:hypothetical protein
MYQNIEIFTNLSPPPRSKEITKILSSTNRELLPFKELQKNQFLCYINYRRFMCFSHGNKVFCKKKIFKILSVKKIFFEGVET